MKTSTILSVLGLMFAVTLADAGHRHGDPIPSNLIVPHNGKLWVYASPCVHGGCSTITFRDGFRFATDAEWANHPGPAAFQNSDGSVKCASAFFDDRYDHCDFGDFVAGHVTSHPSQVPAGKCTGCSETLLVSSVCGDGIVDPGEDCDDGAMNGTTTSCCSGDCTFVPADGPCDDENACTLTDLCDGAGVCAGSDPVVCSALDQCHDIGTCDPATGSCDDPAKPDGSVCDDTDPCTLDDTCEGGVCAGGEPTLLMPLADPDQTLQCVEEIAGEVLP